MSDHKILPRCDHHEVAPQQLPHGAGFVLATLIGAGSVLLGLAVWLFGAGIGWALVVWLAAHPCVLILIFYFAQPPSGGTASGRATFRTAGRRYGRLLNV